jgi:hypothetical protein
VDDDGIEIEVSEEELSEAGWIRESAAADYVDPCERDHCEDNYCGEAEGDVRAALHRYHADAGHRYALRFCDEQPCKVLVQAVGA